MRELGHSLDSPPHPANESTQPSIPSWRLVLKRRTHKGSSKLCKHHKNTWLMKLPDSSVTKLPKTSPIVAKTVQTWSLIIRRLWPKWTGVNSWSTNLRTQPSWTSPMWSTPRLRCEAQPLSRDSARHAPRTRLLISSMGHRGRASTITMASVCIQPRIKHKRRREDSRRPKKPQHLIPISLRPSKSQTYSRQPMPITCLTRIRTCRRTRPLLAHVSMMWIWKWGRGNTITRWGFLSGLDRRRTPPASWSRRTPVSMSVNLCLHLQSSVMKKLILVTWKTFWGKHLQNHSKLRSWPTRQGTTGVTQARAQTICRVIPWAGGPSTSLTDSASTTSASLAAITPTQTSTKCHTRTISASGRAKINSLRDFSLSLDRKS